jgi:hypothetical protein
MESHKDFILEVLDQINEEHHNKYSVYKHIYDILEDTPGCRIPFDNLLSNKCRLLNFVNNQMIHSKAHGKLHACLINVMQGIEPVRVDEHDANYILMEFEEYLKARPPKCGKDLVEESKNGYYLVRKRPKLTSN